MAEDDGKPPPVTAEVLDAVNAAMVALHVRYHGREPATSRKKMKGSCLAA